VIGLLVDHTNDCAYGTMCCPSVSLSFVNCNIMYCAYVVHHRGLAMVPLNREISTSYKLWTVSIIYVAICSRLAEFRSANIWRHSQNFTLCRNLCK